MCLSRAAGTSRSRAPARDRERIVVSVQQCVVVGACVRSLVQRGELVRAFYNLSERPRRERGEVRNVEAHNEEKDDAR